MRWVVDDGPFGVLARYFEPSWPWGARTLEVVESVAAGASADKSGRRWTLLQAGSAEGRIVTVKSLAVGSPAAALVMDYLRRNETSATRDLGEDESIAYCMAEAADATLVTMDKRAAFIALAELGPGRVATPFDLWSWLAGEGVVDARQRAALDEATVKQDSGLPGVPRRLLTGS
jgi:hypothetical protein